MNLNLKLKLLRLSRSIKQNTMAEHLGISQQAYSKWETTKRHFTLEELEKLSAILQVDIAFFMSKDELPPAESEWSVC